MTSTELTKPLDPAVFKKMYSIKGSRSRKASKEIYSNILHCPSITLPLMSNKPESLLVITDILRRIRNDSEHTEAVRVILDLTLSEMIGETMEAYIKRLARLPLTLEVRLEKLALSDTQEAKAASDHFQYLANRQQAHGKHDFPVYPLDGDAEDYAKFLIGCYPSYEKLSPRLQRVLCDSVYKDEIETFWRSDSPYRLSYLMLLITRITDRKMLVEVMSHLSRVGGLHSAD